MKTGWLPDDGANRWIEPLLALAVLLTGGYAIALLLVRGGLPQPFFYQSFDVWMDWFNTAFWAHNPGAYDAWATLYPPISFVYLKPLTWGPCYVANEGWYSRDCDLWGRFTMHGWFVLNIFLTGLTFLKIDRRTALFRSFVVCAGMPMLDALERGNLLMACYTCYLLGHGPLLKSARLRMLFVGMSINFKIYLVGTLFAYAVRRRWRWFEGATLSVIAVYVATWAMVGAGTPKEIITNLVAWAGATSQPSSFLDLWYATTYVPVVSLLTSQSFPILELGGSDLVELGAMLLPLLTHSVQGLIVLAFVAAWLRPEVVPTYRLVNLAGCIAMITSEAGGYVQALITLLTFFEPWRGGRGIRIAIVTAYIVSLSGDIYLGRLFTVLQGGFLNSGPVFYTYHMAIGPFLRPALILLIAASLSCTTMRAVWRDIRTQGWKDRWRFRRDLPLLTGGAPNTETA
ncbi:hypothetical protein [Sphingomonas jatrophae]|uniref:DUF2029 domain-containing protein n=1 Tax=Sphingomonas jatrophae TaxID=1166337 RepID=A0A1I6JRU3_9SPHN|nr:hypothetical protein [Sphingomonas jatrophae]SFR81699.1 hypothetical protein SAMN05192580_0746 [Sphingomonas jatrophae]